MPTRPFAVLAALGLVLATLVGTPPAAAAPEVVWLCHPDLANDPCEIPLDTTIKQAGGTARVTTPARPPAAERPVDCFYVYPTISNGLSKYAPLTRSPEVRAIAEWQAARFSQHCRMFAPVYRQNTMTSLVLSLVGLPRTQGPGYADVVAAWRDYLAHDNHGRGVVLLGHSQGSFVLRQLIADEIEPRRNVRDRLVGAILLGGNVEVARGKLVGGDFDRVPLCSKKGEAGCVVAYSTYADDPDDSATFGNSRGLARGLEIACTDPTRLAGRTGQEFGIVQPSKAFAAGLFAGAVLYTYGGRVPRAPTTWVSPPDRYTGGCARINGDHVFRYRPTGQSRTPGEVPPGWGTHTIDVQLGLGNLTRIVQLQSRTWLKAHR